MKGDAAGALAEIEKEPVDAWRLVGLPMAYFAVGRRADSDRALAELIATHERDAAFNIAYVYAFRGQPDQAFAWLDKAIRNRDTGLVEVAFHPHLAKLHSDPRWLPFLRRIGKAPEQLAKISFNPTVPEER